MECRILSGQVWYNDNDSVELSLGVTQLSVVLEYCSVSSLAEHEEPQVQLGEIHCVARM
jgi:hypothetical protein